MVDFTKLRKEESEHTAVDPRDIFSLLPKKERKFSYLRDVQTDVLKKWFERRERAYNVITMNTGSGKTLVGLLLLKSCLNEGTGCTVYVAPDNYLCKQVTAEAERLGIETTDDPNSPRFRSQRAILIINIHRLFNGLSAFGVGQAGIKIDVGTFLVDDAHACIDRIEEQFTLRVPREEAAYDRLFKLFKSDIRNQSIRVASEIESGTPFASQLIPFWSVQNRIKDLLAILGTASPSSESFRNEMKFKLPLLQDSLSLAQCVFASEVVEFSVKVISPSIIGAFEAARRKIIMSATLPDDGVLLTHLGLLPADVAEPITPETAADIGERLILIPQQISPSLKKNELKDLLVAYSAQINVVVLVPSGFRASYWEDVSKLTLAADNLEDGVRKLQEGHVGLVTMVNKYDGIDLPDAACRLLVIDELPEDRREIDKAEANILRNRGPVLARKIRKIEQGMGRAIRSNEDYCAVLLVGSTLTNYLFLGGAMRMFTPATRAQVELSSLLSEQMKKHSLSELKDVIDRVLARDTAWIAANKSALIHVKYESPQPDLAAFAFQTAFARSRLRDHKGACDALQDVVNKTRELPTKGWLRYHLAAFFNFVDAVQSRLILRSALEDNPRLPLPEEGISYRRLSNTDEQAACCQEYLKGLKLDSNSMVLSVHAILDDLIFAPDTSNRFEEAICNLAVWLGFHAQRPENDFRRGPDDLWAVGAQGYFVIECKNGSTAEEISKADINQLNGSIQWFRAEYQNDCSCAPVIIHCSNVHDYAATADPETRVITPALLEALKEAVRRFIVAATRDGPIPSPEAIADILVQEKLNRAAILKAFSTSIKAAAKRRSLPTSR